MAQTTTQISSNSWVIKIDNASGSLTDISGVDTKATIEPDRESKETFTAEGENAIVTVGKSTVKIAIEIVYSSATAEGKQLLNLWYYGTSAVSKASRTIQLDVPDSATGSDRYTGEVKLSKPPSFELDASKAEPLILKAEFMNDGLITWSTI